MAANAKGKRKTKGKTLDLNTFLGEDHEAPSGFAVVNTRRIDWGDVMENEDIDDRYTLDFKKDERVVLPTAPKAARGPDVDLGRVPEGPPYTAFLGNLPYDVSEDDIAFFFRQLQVKNVRLPRENGDKGRIRGFGYAEFNNRQDLIQALALNNESLKNRAIKVSLAGEHDGERGDRRDGGPDRTTGDWRSARAETFAREEARNDARGGFSDRDSFGGGRSSGYGEGGFSRERNGDRYERNDYGSRNNRDYGGGSDRFERRSNDRGYGFSSDRDRAGGASRGGGGGGRSFERRDGGFGRRDEPPRGDSRYRDSSERDYPPREAPDRRPPDRSSYDSGSGGGQRRKLQLAPRTKPIEPLPPPAEAVGSSSIFGGAKPVDTAAREREIEERLAREKEVAPHPPGGRPEEPRVRKFSSGSGVSNRSRRSSDSGPPRGEDEDHVPPYKPPIPRQLEREGASTLPRSRQRCSSTGSDREHPPKQGGSPRDVHPEEGVFRSGGHHREEAGDGTPYEEPRPPVYTSANKFSHLMNDAEEFDHGGDSE